MFKALIIYVHRISEKQIDAISIQTLIYVKAFVLFRVPTIRSAQAITNARIHFWRKILIMVARMAGILQYVSLLLELKNLEIESDRRYLKQVDAARDKSLQICFQNSNHC